MCGIAGVVQREAVVGGAERLARARALLAHRGPDDWGVLADGPAGRFVDRRLPDSGEAHHLLLLHLRLSILDLSPGGWQPMCSRSGRYAIVFNGEIYNYLELRRELEHAGHEFRSRSDTEVLLAALSEWGTACLGRFVGMFAIACADLEAGEVLLARDHFGIKPLYYGTTANGLAFASEIPALLALTGAQRRLNAERLGSFLRFGTTDQGEDTLFAGIHQIPPGHFVRVTRHPWQVDPSVAFWEARRRPTGRLSRAQAVEQVREGFRENVRLHLQSDVPVGAALSGGIDSSAIVAMVREVAGPEADIHAFSFLPDDPRLSEEPWIRIAAEHARVRLHCTSPTATEVAADLATVIRVQGEPFTSPSMYAQYRVFRLAAQQGIKVMLNGQGGDELFAGYRPYIGARIAGLLRRGSVTTAVRLFDNARRLPGLDRRTVMMLVGDVLAPPGFQAPLRRLVGKDLVPSWMDGEWLARHGAVPASPKHSDVRDAFWAEMERGVRETSLPHLLRYDDRNSMASSIESRVPFLTAPFLDLCWSLPEEYLLDDTAGAKSVFREAMRGIVPDPILDRRDKVGFVTPVAAWMVSEGRWVESLFEYAEAIEAPGLRIREARRIWAEASGVGIERVGRQLWRCLCYLEWMRQFEVEGIG